MLISEKQKVIFVHNQKTGGMSIEKFFNDKLIDSRLLLPRHSYAEQGIHKLGREKWDSYYSFGFVRNPWARLVSWYVMIMETTPKPGANKLWKYVHQNGKSFEGFIANCTDTIIDIQDGFEYSKSFIKPQLEYFTDKSGKVAVDFIGRFEQLQEDFDRVISDIGIKSFELPHENPTKKKDYRQYYNEKTKIVVEERFQKDIEYFGYEF